MKVTIRKSFLFLGLISVLIFSGCSKKSANTIKVAFCGIESQQVRKGFEDTLNEISENKKIQIQYVDLDLNKLNSNKGPDFIISAAGYTTKTILENIKKPVKLSDSLIKDVTSSIKKVPVNENGLKALPLVNDFMELEINTSQLGAGKNLQVGNWETFVMIAKKLEETISTPVIFAGSDPVSFFDIFGALCEALDGVESYNQAIEIMEENKDKTSAEIAELLCEYPDSPFASTISNLKYWTNSKLINRSSYREFIHGDINSAARYNNAGVIFMNLSDHRQCNDMSRFSQFYLPSRFTADKRHFTANIIYGIPVSENSNVQIILEELISIDGQSNLSRTTGLSPVAANARTPDVQADDGRYLVAATNYPLAGLGHETSLSKEKLFEIASEIKIRNNL